MDFFARQEAARRTTRWLLVAFLISVVLVVLAIDAYRARPDPVFAGCAAVCAVVAWLLAPGQMLVWAFVGYTAVLVGRLGLVRRGARG